MAQAVDIRRWLQADRQTPYAQRLERDRAIGRTLAEAQSLPRVLAWWRQMPDDSGRPIGERVEAGRRLAGLALVVLGLMVGAGAAGVAFSYDGRYPVNLFTLLGVLVGLPLLMLLLTVLLLPGRLPALRALQSVAAGMSPGRWVGVWLDRLLGAELFAPALLRGGAPRFARWQLAVFSQWLALGFFAGVLAIGLLLVTFTDLAFGWSTTLNLDSRLIHSWVAALAAPWAAWLPQAAPDAALVEASRYFRLEEGRLPHWRIEQLGAWWPFVLMTIVVYGALPRLLLLLLATWRLRRAIAALLVEDPEVTALLDRLDAPLLDLRGDSAEEELGPRRKGLPPPREPVSARGLVLLIWNGAATPDVARQWLVGHMGADPAGATEVSTLQSEDALRAALAGARVALKEPVRRVLVVTKGWEPPLLEFVDFLGLVREELGSDCSITVVPLDVAGGSIRQPERDVWARALGRVRDPGLYVMDAVSGVGT